MLQQIIKYFKGDNMEYTKENLIITEHANFRYGQRVKNEFFINLASYKALAKTDPTKVSEWENEIYDKFNKSIFLTQSAFDKDNQKSNFFIYKDEKIIFVTTTGNDKIITLYKVDYGFGEDVNNITMNALLKEVEKFKDKRTKYQVKHSKDLEQKEMAINSLDFEINMLKEKIKLLDTQKAIIEAELDLYKNTIDNMSKEIENKCHSIAHSIGYKRQEEFN